MPKLKHLVNIGPEICLASFSFALGFLSWVFRIGWKAQPFSE